MNMKLPTIGSQIKPQAKPQPQAKLQPQPQAKSKAKLQGVGPKSTYTKSTQPTGKLRAFSPLKRLASTLAGFKLREQSSGKVKPNSAKKGAWMKATDAKTTGPKTTGLKNAAPKGIPVSVVQAAADPSAIYEAAAVSNAANTGLPFIKNSKGSRIAFNLLLVRPWVLLIGFWLFSIAVGAVAVEGMVSPKKLKTALPEATVETAALTNKNALIKVDQGSEASATGIAEDGNTAQSDAGRLEANASGRVAAQTAANNSVPVLPLTAMVGTCAAGCLVISRRRAMARMAAARSRSRIRKVRANADASVSKPGQSKLEQSKSEQSKPQGNPQNKPQNKPGRKVAARKISKPKVERSSGVKPAIAKSPAHAFGLKPAAARLNQRRQRDKRAASSQPAASGKRVLVSRFAAQQAAPTQQVSSISRARQASNKAKRKPARLATRHQGVVSVVPASESHALDWTNGSLAHQMDVRPSRTASM